MSKVVVYVLDKIVWILLATIVATQALQIAGVVDAPKGLGDISYTQDNEYNFQISVDDLETRDKRQTQERSSFIDSLFNIPISTLNAVNNLVQSSRPAFQSFREFAQRRFNRVNTKDQETNNQTSKEKVYPVYVRSKDN